MPETSETAFEIVIETHLLGNGSVAVSPDIFDRERVIFYGRCLP